MREYQQKHFLRSIIYSKVTIVILFLFVVLLLRSVIELNDKRIDVEKLRRDSEVTRLDLEAKKNKAETKVADIETPRGFEYYIRTTQPVVKEGEGVIVVYDEEASPVVPVKEDMTVWERLLVFLRPYLD